MITLLLPLLGSCLAQVQQQPLLRTASNPLNKDFAARVHSVIDHFHVPSISIAVIHNGTVHSEGYGTAVFPDQLATAETLYFVGSTTKSFTAATLTLLMDDLRNGSSAFGWDTPVASLIRDDFVLMDEYITTYATLEDLASHRTGFPRHDASYGTQGQHNVRDTVRNMRNLPLTAGFREKFQYCNYMWATLGYIAETVSGKPLGDFLHERLWSVIGMNSTYWTLEDAQAAIETEGNKQLARGYTWDDATKKYYADPYLDIGPIAGAGAMISTVLDYAEYLRMMLHRSGPLSAEAHTHLRRVRTFVKADIKPPYTGVLAYGLGWEVAPYRGVNIISHNGGIYGFGAQMAYVPELDWGVAMLGNTAVTSNFAQEVLTWILIDALLDTPEHARFDTIARYDKILSDMETKLKASRETAFGGSIPDPPLPASLPLHAYEGTYWSDSYKQLSFNISRGNPRIPGLKDAATPVLRASIMDRTWPANIELEHVSGEFFLAWSASPKGTLEDRFEPVSDGFAAEFRIGADARPSELGIAMEPSMGEEKIWFKRM